MTRSDAINELATALAKAQGEIEGAKKDAENPFFKSKYADLAAVREAIQAPLSKHELSYVQGLRCIPTSEGIWIECETLLMHSSGQWIAETLALPAIKTDPQGAGSTSTYARRYALMAMIGVAAEDDDGNASVGTRLETRSLHDSKPKPEVLTVTLKVRGVIQRPSGKDSMKYVVTCDDNQTYQTFLVAHAETAKSAQQAGTSVEMKYRQESWGRAIVSIAELDAVEPPV